MVVVVAAAVGVVAGVVAVAGTARPAKTCYVASFACVGVGGECIWSSDSFRRSSFAASLRRFCWRNKCRVRFSA